MISRIARRMMQPSHMVRYFSEVTSVEGNNPPVNEENVAGRYAGVLFKIASANEILDKVNEDMEYLKELMDSSDTFSGFLLNTSSKRSEFTAVFEEISGGLNETTNVFIGKAYFDRRHPHRE